MEIDFGGVIRNRHRVINLRKASRTFPLLHSLDTSAVRRG